MDKSEFAEAYAWAIANKKLLEYHEPVLYRFIIMLEEKVEVQIKNYD